MKQRKATGVDSVPNEVLKHEGILIALYRVFSHLFDTGLVPSMWLNGIINPIPKGAGKDPYVPLNYRGITLLSCVAKTYTSMLNHRISKYCDTLGLIADEQNGFRKNRACVDHIFALTSIVRNQLQNKQSTFCAFIDMEKAFDWVNRDLLFYSLLKYNIDGKMYKAIKAIYTKTTACVRVNDTLSGSFLANSGVRQGDSLSPTLFALFINDLATTIKDMNLGVGVGENNIPILLYADDIVLISPNEVNLQKMLDAMSKWCFKWRLKLNESKSNIIHFRPKRTPCTEVNFKYGHCELETVRQYKYLGVVLDEYMTFDKCANVLGSSAGRALGGVIAKFREMKNVGGKTFTKMFEAAVVPVCDYASGVWGFKDFSCMNNVQNRSIRYFLGVHRFAPNGAIQGDMGWMPSKYRRFCNIMLLWNRLLKIEDTRLTKKIFLYDYNSCKNNWSSEVKSILGSVQMEQIFTNMLVCDMNSLKRNVSDLARTEWLHEIHNKPKLRTYVKFKYDTATEPYICLNLTRRARSLLAQFRSGILPLNIEVGRYTNVPSEQRICTFCEDNVVEDEFHFVCQCCLYENERLTLYSKIMNKCVEFGQKSEIEKFTTLNKEFQRELADYLVLCWDKRQRVIYR